MELLMEGISPSEHLFMSIYLENKYVHILCPLGENYPHIHKDGTYWDISSKLKGKLYLVPSMNKKEEGFLVGCFSYFPCHCDKTLQ